MVPLHIAAIVLTNVQGISARAFNAFAAMTSADGYKTLLSHLGPDKQVYICTLSTIVLELTFAPG